MISYWLLKIIYWVIWLFFQVLLLAPDVSISETFRDSIITGYSYAHAINSFLPVSELFLSISVVFLAYEGSYLLFKLVNWLIRKIPGIN